MEPYYQQIEDFFGYPAFMRGLGYARSGSVLKWTVLEDGKVTIGSVAGTRAEPYSVIVNTIFTPSGQLSYADGECSCPVGSDCKHCVALLLVALREGSLPPKPGGNYGTLSGHRHGRSISELGLDRDEPLAQWELSLLPAFEEASSLYGATFENRREAVVGLLFEPIWSGKAGNRATGPLSNAKRAPKPSVSHSIEEDSRLRSIRLKPVIPGASGKWVKSGISWRDIDYLHHRGRLGPSGLDQVRLLKELLALTRTDSSAYYYSPSVDSVLLEEINSKRLFDTLRELSEAGVGLVVSGNQDVPVVLSIDKAVPTLDVTRSPFHGQRTIEGTERIAGHGSERTSEGLSARGLLVLDGSAIDQDLSLLIGKPAHMVAFFSPGAPVEGPGGQTQISRLTLAQSDRVIGDDVRELLGGEALRIPASDEGKFLNDFYPAVRLRLTVMSSDGSVTFPEPKPRTLALEVSGEPDKGLSLQWGWTRESADLPSGESSAGNDNDTKGKGRGERAASLEPLWIVSPDPVLREKEMESLEKVQDALSGIKALAESDWNGGGLAEKATLGGMDMVEFVNETLPLISSSLPVTVNAQGGIPKFRESTGKPLITLGTPADQEAGPSERNQHPDWFGLRVMISVEGEEVPFQELFQALAGGKEYMILPSGVYFSLDRQELTGLAKLIEEARSLADSPPGELRISRYQTSWWEELTKLGVVSSQAARWAKSVMTITPGGSVGKLKTPKKLAAELRPYQLQGFQWLTFLYENGLGGILADEMGLGKTMQALALICHARGLIAKQDKMANKTRQPSESPEGSPGADMGGSDKSGEGPFLVVAPTSVVQNWRSECEKFVPSLVTHTITETSRKSRVPLTLVAKDADIVVTSYNLLRLESENYSAVDWAGVFLDEAQFAKNYRSLTYKHLRAINAPFKVAMTGTPMENNLTELWSLTSLVAPGLFPDPDRFNEYYRKPIERERNAERRLQLQSRLRPIVLRRTKAEVASELPEKLEQVIEVELNSRHRKVYDTYLQRERQKVLGMLGDMSRNRFEIFRSLTLLRQASLDVSLVGEEGSRQKIPSTKLDLLAEMTEEIVREGHRALVFSQFTRFLNLARERLEHSGLKTSYLDGKTLRRDRVIDEFREGTNPIFLISLKAGGFGLNLTEADYCILLDPWWNPATEAQAVDRAHRIGQTKTVMVYRIVAKDTIEEKVMALKAKKAALFEDVFGDGELASSDITAEDIRGLLE